MIILLYCIICHISWVLHKVFVVFVEILVLSATVLKALHLFDALMKHHSWFLDCTSTFYYEYAWVILLKKCMLGVLSVQLVLVCTKV